MREGLGPSPWLATVSACVRLCVLISMENTEVLVDFAQLAVSLVLPCSRIPHTHIAHTYRR